MFPENVPRKPDFFFIRSFEQQVHKPETNSLPAYVRWYPNKIPEVIESHTLQIPYLQSVYECVHSYKHGSSEGPKGPDPHFKCIHLQKCQKNAPNDFQFFSKFSVKHIPRSPSSGPLFHKNLGSASESVFEGFSKGSVHAFESIFEMSRKRTKWLSIFKNFPEEHALGPPSSGPLFHKNLGSVPGSPFDMSLYLVI